ncbi:MAG TPA: ABC transporter permease [Bryobacteraceae bacterium]|nr:ABC transporter permease [Bryobacteraceae bacterium]HPT24820.1 ABC transporter permease [Bryobacteraceae bacterium]
MKIPLSYNLRNLAVRRTTTIMTAFGIGLTVAVLAASMSLTAGLREAFRSTGHPLQLILMRKGSGAELSSQVSRESFNEAIKYRPGIARLPNGEPAASPELVNTVNLPSTESPDGMNLTLRGILPVGITMREESKIKLGRWFEFGKREIVVGADIAARYPDAGLGRKVKLGRGDWLVVGVYESAYPARNSELVGDANQLLAEFDRGPYFSSVLLRAQDEVAMQALVNSLNTDQRLQLDILTEKEYYERQSSSGNLIQYVGTFVAIIMAVGSVFAAMNTMYAAVARRSKEIGTLRVLGFSRRSILASFFIESMILALFGGIAGLLLVLPLNGLTTGIGADATFAEIAFRLRLTPGVALASMGFALVVGAIGGLLPAFGAARKQILTALRDI